MQNLNIQDYKEQYFQSTQDHQLIDVRSVGEYMGGHLPNAVNIPLNEIPNRINEIAQDKPVVFVCASGNRSGDAVNWLTHQGFSNVHNLQGGTMMWMMAGLPVKR